MADCSQKETPPSKPSSQSQEATTLSSGSELPCGGPADNEEYIEIGKSKKRTRKDSRGLDLTTGGSISTKARGKRRKTLDLLPTMPWDVLLEILSYLTPKDLGNLSRTSKIFSSTLAQPELKAIWRVSRKQFDVPEAPLGFSESQWATLLFGTKCQTCGSNNVREVDWDTHKRLCNQCRRAHLVSATDEDFSKWMGEYPDELSELLLHTRKSPHTRAKWGRFVYGTKFYFRPEAQAIGTKWNALSSLPDSAAFEEWKSRRKAFVAAYQGAADTYRNWYQMYQISKDREARDTIWRRQQDIIARLLSLGHDRCDVDKALPRIRQHIRGNKDITNKVWMAMRVKLEPLVIEIRTEREDIAKAVWIKSQFNQLDALYTGYLNSLKPSERYSCPRSSFLHSVPNVLQRLDKPGNQVMNVMDIIFIIGIIPSLVGRHRAELHNRLAQSLGRNYPESALTMAKNVFKCGQTIHSSLLKFTNPIRHVVVDWTGICSHQCLTPDLLESVKAPGYPKLMVQAPRCNVALNEEASSLATTLIGMAGLEPRWATVSDMDDRDARYALTAKSIPKWWTTDYSVFTWRGALLFFVERYYNEGKPPPSFRLATWDETERAKQHTINLKVTKKVWTCNHCQDFYEDDKAETQAVIWTHLSERHGVLWPIEGQDDMVNPHLWPLLEEPCEIPLSNRSELRFKCIICALRQQRQVVILDFDELQVHLRQVHSMSDPIAGMDFELDPQSVRSYPGWIDGW